MKLVSMLVLLAAALVGLTAAGARVDGVLGQPFELKAGETATIAGDGVAIGFERVLSDSRCPRDTQCIRAGEATIRVWVEKAPDSRETLRLQSPSRSAPAAYGRYAIALVDVVPYPEADRRPRPEDYVATFVVTASTRDGR